jgi:hypothetical protein
MQDASGGDLGKICELPGSAPLEGRPFEESLLWKSVPNGRRVSVGARVKAYLMLRAGSSSARSALPSQSTAAAPCDFLA